MKKIILVLMMAFSFSFANAPSSFYYSNRYYINPVFHSSEEMIPVKIGTNLYTGGGNCKSTPYYVGWVTINGISKLLIRVDTNQVPVYLNVVCATTRNYYYYDTDYGNNPPPVCTENQTLVNGVCVDNVPTCDFGYHNDTTVTGWPCKPDVDCPPTMKYYAEEVNWGFDRKLCIPNPDLTPEDCANQGGTYISPTTLLPDGVEPVTGAMTYNIVSAMGKGCYDMNYLKHIAFDQKIGEALSFGAAKIDGAFIAQLGKSVFGAGKTLADTIKNLFKTDPVISESQLLLEYKPRVLDVEIQPDGTYVVINFEPKNVNMPPEVDLGVPGTRIYKVDTPDIMPDNVYKGGDISVFEANTIGTKSFLDQPKPMVVPETSPLGTVTKTSIDLKSSLYGEQTQSFPVTSTLLEKQTFPDSSVKTLTKSRISYPDGSYSDVTTLATKFANATKTYEVTVVSPTQTTTGLKLFEQKTTLTENSSGVITNAVSSPATISFVDSSGHVVSTPNTYNESAPKTVTDTSNINLTNVQNSLNQINSQLSQINSKIKEAVDFVPENMTKLSSKIYDFENELAKLDLSLQNAKDFANGLIDTFSDLQQHLDDALNMFDDKPSVNLPSGQCPFTASFYHQQIVVDPCKFVAPYRPIMVVFLTFFMSLGVFLFAIKYLFNVSIGGGK
ncbi:MAG: hypothetical protein PHN38_04165 [Sulfurospirillaceae bacterium]|nr:hypothetical protein [Sulfurospirillaceae bacterium]